MWHLFAFLRIGYRMPMLVGCGLNLLATLCFAYLRNFSLLVVARSLQALGSSFSVVGGKKSMSSLCSNQINFLWLVCWSSQSNSRLLIRSRRSRSRYWEQKLLKQFNILVKGTAMMALILVVVIVLQCLYLYAAGIEYVLVWTLFWNSVWLVLITSFCEKVSWSGRNWNSFWVRTRMFNPRIAILRQCLPCNPGSNDFQVLESPNLMSNCWLNMNFVLAMAYLAASFKDDTSRLKAASIAFSGFSVGIAGKSSTLLSCCVRQCFLKKISSKSNMYIHVYICLLCNLSHVFSSINDKMQFWTLLNLKFNTMVIYYDEVGAGLDLECLQYNLISMCAARWPWSYCQRAVALSTTINQHHWTLILMFNLIICL